MNVDTAYRLALLLLLTVVIAIVLYHRLRAASTGEAISRKLEGYAFAIALRLAGLMLFLATLAYLIYPPAVSWAAVALPKWLRWSGAVWGVVSVGLIAWTLATLGKNLTDTVATRTNAALVTSGPYGLVRHPYYSTAAMLMASVSLLAANWFIAACGAAVMGMLAVRTPKEEQMLIERFGAEYRKYQAGTGMFVPKFGAKARRST